MTKPESYPDFLRSDFQKLFDALDLSDRQKHFMRSRWLDQVIWMEQKAARCRDQYHRLRLVNIIFSVVVPILVGLDAGNNASFENALKYTTMSLGGVVAVSAAVEKFFNYGERWYHYRQTVESLKTQGWQFSQLSGAYHSYKSFDEAFDYFVNQVEEIIQRDVAIYVSQGAKQENQSSQS